ncbi:hypothetical protein MAR_026131 [Mya arenaria]|uniref:NACHT domain-containing protein n=2 Tax=Mya arenaria TaxID=6604 RepID=A0ABY7EXP1_MYAAR|nr:uncharacterized protein LOC128243339 isoform X1 [Mya arenaria]WAR11951.1 hypothetical protein MAR_026131 [Mya arenaria]
MADTGDDSLNNTLFRNWLKVVLSLRILASGLTHFVEKHCKQLHRKLISKAEQISNSTLTSCSQCFVKTILPWHVYKNGGCPAQKTAGVRCRCKTHGAHVCPTIGEPCSVMHDLIVAYHHSHNPLWRNTDCQSWVNDYWSVAKCYLSTTGYASSTSAADMDCTGLLSLCINNDFLRRHIDDISNFEKVRNWRNTLFHSPNLELSESDMKAAIQDMINLLKDGQDLINESAAQSVAAELSKITSEDFVLTLAESKKMLFEMMNAIEYQKDAAIREINEYTDTKLDDIRVEFVKCRGQVLDMEAFQKYLVETYEKYYIKSDVSPLFPEEDDNIDDLYVSLKMERRAHTLGKEKTLTRCGADIYKTRTSEVAEQLNTFEELFQKNGERVENIFIVADAGMGKTTLCRKITSTWCTCYDEQICNASTENSVETTMHCTDAVRKISTGNQQCMLQFRFLFYVSLRHATTEHSIEEMVEHQLLQEKHINLFHSILEKIPQQCLFIVDGLDEWKSRANEQKSPKTIDGLPAKNCKCTTLITTRPWKFAEVRPRTSDVDSEVHLKGISFKNASILAGIALGRLNKSRGKCLKVENFIAEIRKRNLMALVGSPLMLKLLLCTWFDNNNLPGTKTQIYSTVVKLMIRMYTEKRGENRDQETHKEERHLEEKLPFMLQNFSEFTSHARMLLALGEFSFKTFVKSNTLVFELSNFEQYGMTKKDTRAFLEMGLLSKSRLRTSSVTSHTVQISYIHRSFQEYFAALHLSGHQEQIETILAMCKGSRRLAEHQGILHFTSGFEPKIVRRISEHIYKDGSEDDTVDDAIYTIVQKTLVSCISEAGLLRPKPGSVYIKILRLTNRPDLDMLPLINPECVCRLDITEHVQLEMKHIDCIFAMTNLCHLVIMNDNKVLKSNITVALLQTCIRLKCLELDDYNFLNVSELTILPISCHLSYIRLFRCQLTHSQITSMICDVPTLEDLKLWTVTCEPDRHCGCLKQIKSVSHPKCKIENQKEDDARLESAGNGLYYLKSISVSNCQVYESSGVFTHLKDSNSLTCLKVTDSTIDTSFLNFLGQCFRLEDLELDFVAFSGYSEGCTLNGGSLQQLKLNDVDIDYRIIISTINGCNTTAPLDIKMNHVRLIGINADKFKCLLSECNGVSIGPFSGNKDYVQTTSLKVVNERTDLVGKTDVVHEGSTTKDVRTVSETIITEIAPGLLSRSVERTSKRVHCVLF